MNNIKRKKANKFLFEIFNHIAQWAREDNKQNNLKNAFIFYANVSNKIGKTCFENRN